MPTPVSAAGGHGSLGDSKSISKTGTPTKGRDAGTTGAADYDKMDDVMGQAWVEDAEEVWRLATVRGVSADGDQLSVSNMDEETTTVVEKVKSHPFDPSHAIDMDDLAHLNNMHEAPLLHVLKRRFRSDKIYTTCSDVLISVNPYKKIPLLYDLPSTTTGALLDQQPMASSSSSNSSSNGGDGDPRQTRSPTNVPLLERRPHVYSVAARAFRFMTEPNEALLLGKNVALKNQSIIISGESGAGKTEASKFGKYIKLQYDAKRTLVGAWTDHFLLEKSRLVHVDPDERNYHIFYEMLQGLPAETLAELRLTDSAEDYRMLAQGGCWALDDVDDREEFEHVAEALATLGVNEEERAALWRLLAILLHLGNLEFGDEGEEGAEHVQLSSPHVALSEIAELLGVTPDKLVQGVTRRTTHTQGSTLTIPLNVDQTRNNVQAVIKYVYGEAFHWILRKINSCHATMASSSSSTTKPTAAAASAGSMASFIGILDIFGFEIMTRNSFEQLCINFANEVLQQQFNMHVFVLEQQEYVAEELDWSVISFRDNQPVIDLISKKPLGLLIMLEEQGLLGRKANNDALLTSYHNTHLGKVECYAKPRFHSDEFIVKHFAGQVTYSTAGFIEKNNDSLHDDLLDLWRLSDDAFFRNLLTDKPTPDSPGYIPPLPTPNKTAVKPQVDLDGRSINPPSSTSSSSSSITSSSDPNKRGRALVGGKLNVASPGPGAISGVFTVSCTFRRQLEELTATLKATEPHYIKCIKPNAIKAAGGFSPRLVVQQLRYSGVLEVVRIRREAYPTRILFEDFYRRFDVLLGSCKPASLRTATDYRAACQAIVTKVLPVGGFQLGKRKIFLRDNGLDLLRDAIRDFYASHAARIQALIRGFLGVRRYLHTRCALLLLQRSVRMHLLRKKFLRHRQQIVQIQAIWRGHRQLLAYKRELRGAMAAQKCTRRWLAIRLYSSKARQAKQQREEAATICSAVVRGYLARCVYRRERAATRLNAIGRGFLARKQYRALLASVIVVAFLRGNLARKRFQQARAAVLKLQSVVRMRMAVRELGEHKAARRIQTMARAWAARKTFCTLRTQARLQREKEERSAALTIQGQYKAYQTRTKFLAWRRAAIVLQAQARCTLACRLKRRSLAAIVLFQAHVRRCWCQQAYHRIRATIRIQTLARRYSARKIFIRLRAAVRLQAWARGRAARHKYVEYQSAVKIQAMARGHAQRRRYCRARGIIKLQSLIRGVRARRAYQQVRTSVLLLQRVVRRFLDVILEERRVHKLHLAAGAGKVSTVHRMLDERPWLAIRRDRKAHFRTLIHSAALAEDISVMALLKPRYEDLIATDGQGDTPLHLAAGKGSLDLAKKFAAVCDGLDRRAWQDASSSNCAGVPNYRRKIGGGGAGEGTGEMPRASFRIASVGIDSWDDRRRSARAQQALAVPARTAAGTAPGSPQRPGVSMGIGRGSMAASSVSNSPARSLAHTPSHRQQKVQEVAEVGGSNKHIGSFGAAAARTSVPSRRGGFEGLSPEELQLACDRAKCEGQVARVVQSNRLKAGWLKKRRETDRFNRRWCVLTDTELRYYHAPADCPVSKVIKLKPSMLKVCDHIDFAFEIHSPLLLDRRNREGRLYFQAENEMDLQGWLAKLRMVMGQTTHMYGRRAHPIQHVNLEQREVMVACMNEAGQTPLHALVRSVEGREGKRSGGGQPQMVQLAMWLIDNGADVNAQDLDGNTTAHLAALAAVGGSGRGGGVVRQQRTSRKGGGMREDLEAMGGGMSPETNETLFRLIGALAQKGANLTLRNKGNQTVVDLMAQSRQGGGAKLTGPGQTKMSADRALFPSPSRLPGCSYVSFFVERLAMAEMNSEKMTAPFFKINVYSSKQQQVERTQVMTYPALQRGRSMWWGWTWHMQTPVEHLSPGSFAVLELVDRAKGPKAWALLHVDDSHVDSGSQTLEMYRYPLDLKLQRLEPADFFLTGDMWVTRATAVGEKEGSRAPRMSPLKIQAA
ncbi:myosin-like protein [Nannochloropsis oceanica]